MEKVVSSLEDFNTEAEVFARGLRPRASGATLITLSGELGAGKTAFVKVVAKTFGVDSAVTSPTFVLEKIYELRNAPFEKLIHIDAYRLENGSEIEPLNLVEIMKDPKKVVLLEWPERVLEALPEVASRISIVVQDDGSRKISYA